MGNKNFRRPQPKPSPSVERLKKITELRKEIDLEQIFERKTQAEILSEILKRHHYDMPPEESYRLLEIRRISVTTTNCGAQIARS